MGHQLAGLGSGGAPAAAVEDVVEPELEEPQHVLAGDAVLAAGFVVEVAELLLGEPVGEPGLLLLLQLQEELGLVAAAPAATVLTRRVRTLVQRAGFADGAEDVGAESAGDTGLGAGVAGHVTSSGAWVGGNHCEESV